MAIRDSEGWDYFPTAGSTSQVLARIYGALGYYDWYTTGSGGLVLPSIVATDAPYGYGKFMRLSNFQGYICKLLPTAFTEGFVGMNLRSIPGDGGDRGFYFDFIDPTSQRKAVRVRFDDFGVVKVYRCVYSSSGSITDEVLIGTSSPGSFPENQWFYAEIKFVLGSDLEVRINTEVVLSLVDASINSSPTPCASFQAVGWYPDGFAGMDIDNWHFDDSQYNGVVRVQWQPPMAAGDQTEWTSWNLSMPNWQSANNENMDDSRYVFNSTQEPGDYDLYRVTPLINSPEVLSVAVKGAYRQNDATQFFVQNVLKSGAATTFGVLKPANNQYKFNIDRYNVDPNTGLPWTYNAVNALQIGPKQED